MATIDALIDAGHALEDRGDFDAALQLYRQAVAAGPSYPRAHMNVGNALRRLERWDEAVSAQRDAVACAPDYAPARFNLGSLLAERGDPAGAEHQLLEALRLQPDLPQPSIVLADIYEQQERFDEAEAQFHRILQATPDHAGTLLNFGMFCFRRGRFDESYTWLQRARAADPQLLDVESFVLMGHNYRTDLDAQALGREHARVGIAITAAAGPPFTAWPNAVDPERKIRIGYVSGDFMHHPVALFLRPVLEQHNPKAFDVFCYSNHAQQNPVADRLRGLAAHWRDIAGLDDHQTADLIRRDAIDILVDLSGHTARNRLGVFARHPAPVHATWLGYLNSTGLAAMDYRICDAWTDPEGETEDLHTERLVRMPYSQWCYAPWYDIERVSRPHPERPEALVFGSFNQHVKITDAALRLWSMILAALPESELLVLDVREPATRQSLMTRMTQAGMDPAQVTLRGREAIGTYFRAIGNVDIALDTFPYNGGTTTLDTLWMDTPLVALRGDRGISRGSYSILKTLGADELIAYDADEYIELNIRLARDRAWRERLRETLRPLLEASPLMDAAAFTRALESRYRDMWRTWCSARGETTADQPRTLT